MARTTAEGGRTRRSPASPQGPIDPPDTSSFTPARGFSEASTEAPTRNGRSRRQQQSVSLPEDITRDLNPAPAPGSDAKSKRRRGNRGGRRHRRSTAPATEAASPSVAVPPEEPPKRERRSRAASTQTTPAKPVE